MRLTSRHSNRLFPIDVLGLGCVAVDDLCYVSSYPPADAKRPVLRRQRQFGGLIGNALVAASRLGARCAFAGTLGKDDLSLFAQNQLAREKIDLSTMEHNAKARPVHSFIVVSEAGGSRNIFFDPSGLVPHGHFSALKKSIAKTRVLLIDHYDPKGKLNAVRFARERGVPVVADFEGHDETGFSELLRQVDHLILSLDFARTVTTATTPASIARELWNDQRKVIVITCGSQGCWLVSPAHPDKALHFPAFHVKTADTTGCGDVFHGAYAAALARQLPLEECLRIASASAALTATRTAVPGRIPRRKEVESFLLRASA